MKKTSIDSTFENLVKAGLEKCLKESRGEFSLKLENLTFGVAVSGGADSISLLVALQSILAKNHLKVITINHNIRPEKESAGDADFVEDFCKKRGVFCKRITFAKDQVQALARERNLGVEEAARFLRYQAFESFIHDEGLDYLCLAHNQNDQTETLVMRFLQGSGIEGLGGIPCCRDKFIRPLLAVSRTEIEQYLTGKSLSWVTDATNFESHYTRNKIRNELIPTLNHLFPGWQKSVLSLAKKALADEKALGDVMEKSPRWNVEKDEGLKTGLAENPAESTPSCLSMADSAFFGLGPALGRRCLYQAFSLLFPENGGRLSFNHIEQIFALKENRNERLSFEGLEIFIENNRLFIKKLQKPATESGFLGIIEKEGDEIYISSCNRFFSVDEKGTLLVKKEGEGYESICAVSLPVSIRSFQSGDCLYGCDGQKRSVTGIFSAWHVKGLDRNLVPLVEDLNSNKVVALLGGILGKENWIDRDYVQK